jgi:uncharacterized membrane protein YdjX (TVP38/TMEM64 family)
LKNPTDNRVKTNRSLGKWIGIITVVIAVIILAVVFRLPARTQALLQAALRQIQELGSWGPAVFILLYVIACMAVIPASLLTIGGGTIFGVVKGSIYVSIAATLGATAAFLIGRYFARDWIHRKIGRHPAFVAIDKAVAEEGWKIVFLTRLCPIFPFFLMNYAYGLTRVSLRHYVLATWIGIMPGSTLFVYIGSLANVADAQTTTAGWILKAFILVTAVWAIVYISKVARRALSKRIPQSEGEVVK